MHCYALFMHTGAVADDDDFVRERLRIWDLFSQSEMDTVLSSAVSVAEGHVQNLTASLFNVNWIIWSRDS